MSYSRRKTKKEHISLLFTASSKNNKKGSRLSAHLDSFLDLTFALGGGLADVFVPLVTSHGADFNNMGPF